jgi:hypothetical protein
MGQRDDERRHEEAHRRHCHAARSASGMFWMCIGAKTGSGCIGCASGLLVVKLPPPPLLLPLLARTVITLKPPRSVSRRGPYRGGPPGGRHVAYASTAALIISLHSVCSRSCMTMRIKEPKSEYSSHSGQIRKFTASPPSPHTVWSRWLGRWRRRGAPAQRRAPA